MVGDAVFKPSRAFNRPIVVQGIGYTAKISQIDVFTKVW